MEDGHRQRTGGARPLLDEAQRLELAAAIEAPVPAHLDGGIWSGRKVARWVKAATGRAIRPQQGCVYLRQPGFGLRVPRPRLRRAATPEEQTAWKKARRAGREEVRAAHPQAQVEVRAQDEARLGLKPVVRRVWAKRGKTHRPPCPGEHRHAWMDVFGFVRPASGQAQWWLLGGVNTPAMSAVLAEFAQAVGAGQDKRVILGLDRAGWHVSKDLLVPEGIHLCRLPASTPELQPAERLWPPLREAVANGELPGSGRPGRPLERALRPTQRPARLPHRLHPLPRVAKYR